MTLDDVTDILTAIAAVDRRQVGEAEIRMWHQIIGHLPKDLCLEAVVAHFRERPGVWCEPGHIVADVRAVLRDRYERQTLAERSVSFDELDERLKPRIVELTEAKSIDVPLRFAGPSADPTVLPVLRVPWPWEPCRAPVGARCNLSGGRTHDARMRRAHGLPPADPPRLPTRLITADPRCSNCGREIQDEVGAARGLCDKCADAVDGPQRKPNGNTA